MIFRVLGDRVVPLGVLTDTSPVTASAGIATVRDVVVPLMIGAGRPLIQTIGATRLDPGMADSWLSPGPTRGGVGDFRGAGAADTVSAFAEVAEPNGVVTRTGPVTAPLGEHYLD